MEKSARLIMGHSLKRAQGDGWSSYEDCNAQIDVNLRFRTVYFAAKFGNSRTKSDRSRPLERVVRRVDT